MERMVDTLRNSAITADEAVRSVESNIPILRDAFSWVIDHAQYGKYVEDPAIRNALVVTVSQVAVRPRSFGTKLAQQRTLDVTSELTRCTLL